MFHWICTLVENHQGLWTMNLFLPGIVTTTSQSAHQLTLPAKIQWANKTRHIMYNSSCQLAVHSNMGTPPRSSQMENRNVASHGDAWNWLLNQESFNIQMFKGFPSKFSQQNLRASSPWNASLKCPWPTQSTHLWRRWLLSNQQRSSGGSLGCRHQRTPPCMHTYDRNWQQAMTDCSTCKSSYHQEQPQRVLPNSIVSKNHTHIKMHTFIPEFCLMHSAPKTCLAHQLTQQNLGGHISYKAI